MGTTTKVFKLIKLYPSLSEKAKIGDYLNLESVGYGVESYVNRLIESSDTLNLILSSKSNYFISKKEVENNPDFFEECEITIKIKK